jgi:FkbM family methyltransferase
MRRGISNSAMNEFNRLKDCRHGKMLYNVNDYYVGRSLDVYGEFSEGEIELFSRIVRPSDVVIDIGANIGAHTLFFAKATSPNGAVFAFEPQRIVFQTLCANMALNSIVNAFCFQQAVGAASGSILVPELDPRSSQNFGGVDLQNHPQGMPVPLIRLDDCPLVACRLLKIDVEGMEADVLRGGRQFVARHRPIVYLENDRPEKSAELIALLREMRYELFWHEPNLFNPNNFSGHREDVFENIISRNMLCLPEKFGERALADGLNRVDG